MMQHHRCSTSSHGNMACSCGVYQCNYNYTQGNNSSFSTMLFSSNGGHHNNHYRGYDEENVDGCNYYSSPSVDCTLSLGTPSTRLSGNENGNGNNSNNSYHHQEKKRSSYMSGFGWNILQSKHTTAASATKSHRVGGGNSGGDPLLARRCANCDTTSTPLWRNGPRGPKSLCNACGIRFKKEERRATAAANGTVNGGADGSNFAQPQKIPCYSSAYGNEYRFIEEHEDHNQYGYHHRDSVDHANYPFMSWRFNVTDRPSLVHDFTR